MRPRRRHAKTEEKDRFRKTRRALILVLASTLGGGFAGWRWLERRGVATPARAMRQEYAPVAGPLEFPDQIRTASADLRELYEFAARRPDVLHYVPCFCGCGAAGHQSAYDCFIDRVDPDGTVHIDDMGFT